MLAYRICLCILLCAIISLEVAAQDDISVPSIWVGTNASDDRVTREGLAHAAAQSLVQRISENGSLLDDDNSQALAAMYSTLALQDVLSGNRTWKNVTTSMKNWVTQIDIFTNGTAGSQKTTSNALQWGLAFFYAYQAYNDTSFLTLAQTAYDQVLPYLISSDAASSFTAPGNRNLTFNASNSACFSSAAGGIFWLPDDPGNAQVQLDAVGPFAILSGYLYQATSNDTYKANGLLSVSFMGWPTYVFNTTILISHGVVDVFNCRWNGSPEPAVEGWYIQALSVWANITSDGSLTERLRQVVSATARNTAWSQTDGVLTDNQAPMSDNVWDDKAILVRALSETRRRFAGSADLVQFITAFLTVQYNALSSNARQAGSSSYSTSLVGRPPNTFSTSGNIVALDILNAAFDAVPVRTGETSPSSKSSAPVGAIAGGVVGGVAGLVAIAGALFWWCRRRQHARPMLDEEDRPELEQLAGGIGSAPVAPYTLTATCAPNGKGAPPSAVYRGGESNAMRVEGPANGEGQAAPVSAQPEEISALMGLRRLVGNIIQEHTSQSAPPAYAD